MVQWHHWLNGHEFQQTPGDNEDVMQSMGSQTVGHDLMTEEQQHVLSQERNTGSLIQVLYSFPWLPPLCQGLCQISVLWYGIMSTVTNMTSMHEVPSLCKMSLVFFRFPNLLRISTAVVIFWSLKFCPKIHM